MSYYKEHPEALLSEAKKTLADEITYSQLKLVKHHVGSLA